jgi:predicted RNase H-like HicB family nuclease
VVQEIKIIIEKSAEGFVAYPVGLKGVVVGQGDTYEDALADVRSAISFHIETFGPDALGDSQPEAIYIAEAAISTP